MKSALDWLAPLIAGALALGFWEGIVWFYAIDPFILPAPSQVARSLWTDAPILLPALAVTLGTTCKALALATIGGAGLAVVLSQSRVLERALTPFAIILQVTPVIAIAPLLLVWLDQDAAVLTCAFLVAFFPILSNSAMGLASTDRGLVELFALYRASRWRELTLLRIPAALPYFMNGLRIGGGLALVGAVAAELAAGASGKGAGLAFRISEAGYRLNISRMFAGLVLIALSGLIIYGLLALASRWALRRWHESFTREA